MQHIILTVQTVTLICAYFEPCLNEIIQPSVGADL